ncbi:MAG: hypothetical protein LBS53_15195 [Synergistaceae bacterium]|jgi:hypothetical protein|nr:hypothetical protein [Synergistaceae bacterium]
MKSRKILEVSGAAFLLAALVVLPPDIAPAAGAGCGVVEELTRTAMVVRSGKETELALGDAVYSSDSIRTGELGYAVVKFVDDTLMAIGSNSAVAITEVQFVPKSSSLHIGIDRGAVWISIGSIGLVNPNSVRIATPKALVSSGNATLQFEVGSEENVRVQWMPKGGRVSVYSVKTKERMELREADLAAFITSKGELSAKPAETPEDEAEKTDEAEGGTERR